MLNRNKYEISGINGITRNNPDIPKRNRNSGQNPGNSGESTLITYVIYTTSVHISDVGYMTNVVYMKKF